MRLKGMLTFETRKGLFTDVCHDHSVVFVVIIDIH